MLFDFFKRNRRKPPPPDAPDYWNAYHALFEREWDSKQLIEDTRFVVFDTETTGLDIKIDRILSIGAVGVQHGQINLSDSLECLIHQPKIGSAETIKIHGILAHNMEKGKPEAEALQQFVEYIQDAVLVGHHVNFDIAIINQALQRTLGDQLQNRVLDTARLAIRFEHLRHTYNVVPANYSLDALCDRYQIPTNDRHTAAGDAFITAILFLKLVRRLQDRGLTTVGELMRG